MFVTLINDCKSENDIGRLKTRYSLLFPKINITFIGVESNLNLTATLEAGGNLIDVLDAAKGKTGIIALNIAPRRQTKLKDNGADFCFFWYKKVLVTATLEGYNLSLVKKFRLINFLNLVEVKKVLDFAEKNKLVSKSQKNFIAKSQFRSFEFQPYLARWVWEGEKVPLKKLPIDEIPNPPSAIWLIDSFGNAKTTLLKEDIESVKKKSSNTHIYKLKTNLGSFSFYQILKDIPDGITAIYEGSSGIGEKRFLEIATKNRNGSAKKALGLNIGDEIKLL